MTIAERVVFGMIFGIIVGILLLVGLQLWTNHAWETVCEESLGGAWVEGNCLEVQIIEP